MSGASRSSRRRSFGALASFALIAGCSPVPQTEIVVVVSSDLPRGTALQSVRVIAQRSGVAAPMLDTTYGLTDTRYPLPGEVTLVARDPDDARPVTVRIIGQVGGQPLQQESVVHFRRERTLYLQMTLSSMCVGRDCGTGQTCRLGVCVTPEQIQPVEARPSVLQPGDAAVGSDLGADVASVDRPDAQAEDVVDGGMGLDVADDATDVPGMDAPDVPAEDVPTVDAPDVPPVDVPDVTTVDVPDAPALDASDVPAVDAPDVPDAPAVDAPDVPAVDVPDVPDVLDVPAVDAPDAPAVDVPPADVGPPDSCPSGRVICAAGCADLQTDPMHCGACGRACSLPNGVNQCAFGTCLLDRCNDGFGDCSPIAPGCETDLRTSATHCGRCGNACPAVVDGAPTCAAGTCGARCEPNWVAQSGRCVPDFPRPISPISGSRLTGALPTLRWAPVAGSTETLLRICQDRACTAPVLTTMVSESSYTPVPLPRGRYYWSVAQRRGGTFGPLSPIWQFSVGGNGRTRSTRGVGAYPDYDGDAIGDAVAVQIFPTALRVFSGTAAGLPPAEVHYVLMPACGMPTRGVLLGDVNGDGYSDLQYDCNGNVSYRFHGGPMGPVVVPGTSHAPILAGVGDVDGDGYGDALTPGGDVIFGSRAGLNDGAPMRLALPTSPTLTGDSTIQSAAGWADVNNDGRSEVAVGRLMTASCGAGCSDCGRVMVYSLPAACVGSLTPTTQLSVAVPQGDLSVCSHLGDSLAWADLNADGSPDLIAGAPWWSGSPSRGTLGRQGAVFQSLGNGTSLDPLTSPLWEGGFNLVGFGVSIVSPGDLAAQDGYEDIIVFYTNSYGPALLAGGFSGSVVSRGMFSRDIVAVMATGHIDADELPEIVGSFCEPGGASGFRLWRGSMGFDASSTPSQRLQLGFGCLAIHP